jgi:hypothetical protein
MTISGSLETFSLPELFQIIDSGHKSGKLIFKPDIEIKDINSDLHGTFELWFDRGNFVTIINSLKYQSLIDEIQTNTWVSSKLLVKSKYSCPKNTPFGNYLQEQNFITQSQIDSLFKAQVDTVCKLFNISSAQFKFEELDHDNKIPSDGELLPYKEMTGKQKKASELTLEGMRILLNWSHFAEELPAKDMGLQKLVNHHDSQFTTLENHLWNAANGSISLNKIALTNGFSIEEVQQAALAMIFIGLVEEVLVTNQVLNAQTAYKYELTNQPVFAEPGNIAIKTKNKSKVSNSLINNLVSFLRNNF